MPTPFVVENICDGQYLSWVLQFLTLLPTRGAEVKMEGLGSLVVLPSSATDTRGSSIA